MNPVLVTVFMGIENVNAAKPPLLFQPNFGHQTIHLPRPIGSVSKISPVLHWSPRL